MRKTYIVMKYCCFEMLFLAGDTFKLMKQLSRSYTLFNEHFVNEPDVLLQFSKENRDSYRTFILDLECNDSYRLLEKVISINIKIYIGTKLQFHNIKTRHILPF